MSAQRAAGNPQVARLERVPATSPVTSTESRFPSLREIRGIDCPTPKCFANASCTGRVTWDSSGAFWIETECPDCQTCGLHATPATKRLGDALMASAPDAHEDLIREFIRTRPAGAHPLRDA
jgi:hypothetical protein